MRSFLKTLVHKIKWWRWFLGGPIGPWEARKHGRENMKIAFERHRAKEPKP